MVFFKSLTRELTFNAVGVFIVLLAILVSTQAINLLGRAAEGDVANDAVAALIGFWALGLFPVPLILTVFISTLVVLTRLWRDQEMQVWLAAGLSQKSLLGPILRFAVPLSMLVGVVAIGIAPWADQRSQAYADQLKQREDISAISPGVFKESSDANRVYFVENYAGQNGSAKNIFFQDLSNGQISTILAKSGHLATDDINQRIIVLENGYRYVGVPGQANFDVINFKRYIAVIGKSHDLVAAPRSRQSLPTTYLLTQLNDPSACAELAWRFSLPFSCLILAILAIPLSYSNPRSGGQAFNLIAALLSYFAYQNGLTVVRNSIMHGSLPAWSIIFVHLAVLIIALLGLLYRDRPAQPLWQSLRTMLIKKA
ncbi:MAG: LPS export ABC transporter permease LptF [Paludibacterium sp.]|uniref:LPS export ABC transporter permease LptF n=1 Tax=Paludibacterium sp. TaxID=1917523 RepID=UPI0025F70A34|nr:LPS export ABC transporter permease LptF [Paludibacterium sp.]MBV8046337.1 LPS export ABC transporter permease LptF [Paludibacterium sp.]MBV8649547.1 LPS export ABC transporter permease LptF [Paludibacterium sp.]